MKATLRQKKNVLKRPSKQVVKRAVSEAVRKYKKALVRLGRT